MRLNFKRKIDSHQSAEKLIELLLEDRGIINKDLFTNPPHPTTVDFNSFFDDKKAYAKQLKKVITKLETIKKNNEMIVVYSDYDADGITGGAILWETLHMLGFKVMPHVPDRKKEGYGFSTYGIDLVKKNHNPKLIISVDHGIAAADKIDYAKSIGIPIVVTDHHQKGEREPDSALAIFHTDKLSGSGVAYFFAKELFKYFGIRHTKYKILDTNFTNDYVSLAAIGMIADLVPLTNVARSVAKHGLASLSKSSRVGFVELLKQAGIQDKQIGTYDVGFIIAPRINAFGRLENGLDGLRLLCTPIESKAKELAQKAGDTNKRRQDLVEAACNEAMTLVDTHQKILIVYKKDWEEGIIGLIASKLLTVYKRPAITMTDSDSGIKGSARSIKGFDITNFLRKIKKDMISVGGHKAAAGFTIKKNKINEFIKEIQTKAKIKITDEMLIPVLEIDMALPLSMATIELGRELEIMAPFGMGNPKPVFYSTGVIVDVKTMGKTKNHLKLYIKNDNSFPLEILFFGDGGKSNDLSRGQTISVAYTIEINRWGGKETLQGMGKVMVPT